MDTGLLYSTLPIFNTVFSLISKETLKAVDPVTYTSYVLFLSAVLSLLYNHFSGIKTIVNVDSVVAGVAFGIATLLFEEAVHRTNNPGLANAVYRSQAALTAIVSVFILGSSLSVKAMLGIVITVASASAIALAKTKEGFEPFHLDERTEDDIDKDKKPGNWIPYAIAAGLLATVKDITGVLSVRGKRMTPSSFVFSQAMFGAIVVAIYQYYKFGTISTRAKTAEDARIMWTGIISAAIDNFVWCAVLIYLMNKAKNPAFPKAVQMSGIVLTSIASGFLFNDASLNKMQWAGVIGVVSGIALMSM